MWAPSELAVCSNPSLGGTYKPLPFLNINKALHLHPLVGLMLKMFRQNNDGQCTLHKTGDLFTQILRSKTLPARLVILNCPWPFWWHPLFFWAGFWIFLNRCSLQAESLVLPLIPLHNPSCNLFMYFSNLATTVSSKTAWTRGSNSEIWALPDLTFAKIRKT